MPILGKVTAGLPILAVEDIEGYIPYPDKSGKELFALHVDGLSMINAGILDGDHVIVQQQSSADNGDMVVALVDDSATVKTFYKEEDHYRLQPQNDAFSPIIVKHCEILGKEVSVSEFETEE